MKPNIFFLSIDSLRADRIYGKNKTSYTPNIDSLVNNGIYFTQAISTSDATGLSLGSIFTASYPFKTGITHFNYDPNIPSYFDLLKKNGYNIYATVPDVSFFLKLTENFTEKDAYVYDKRESWLQLSGGIGNQIVDRLKNRLKEPWIYFIHLMDLHTPFQLPSEFNLEKYGKTRYDKMVSVIDYWIGNFVKNIDLQTTIVILTSDHGDYIPVIDEEPKETKIHTILKKGKQAVPTLEPVGLKLYSIINSIKKSLKRSQLKKTLAEDEMRTLNSRGQWHLYDELVRIPIVFSGFGITRPQIIHTQVRQVDIFPTLVDILQLPALQSTVDGISLLPIMENKSIKELPAYIETGSRDPKKFGNIIGIRTPNYKYLRSRYNPKEHVSLFDLQTDPHEKNNIAQIQKEIVQKMESMLENIRKNLTQQKPKEVGDDESKKIEEELRKLGYL
ncbi:MAG: sulfatase-like hydrolase/transferase [Nitrososphaerota archaeon]